MTCSGCAQRREWIKKWAKIAYERATGKGTNSGAAGTNRSSERTDGSDKPPG